LAKLAFWLLSESFAKTGKQARLQHILLSHALVSATAALSLLYCTMTFDQQIQAAAAAAHLSVISKTDALSSNS